MKLTIETLWNKVVDDPAAPFGTRVLPEYERKSLVSYPNGGGWTSRREWEHSVKHRHGFVEFDSSGRAKFRGNRAYGIDCFQLVSLEE